MFARRVWWIFKKLSMSIWKNKGLNETVWRSLHESRNKDELEELVKANKLVNCAQNVNAKAQAVLEGFVLVEKKNLSKCRNLRIFTGEQFSILKNQSMKWSHVSNLGVGSNSGLSYLRKRFNIDPEATFRKPQRPTNDWNSRNHKDFAEDLARM